VSRFSLLSVVVLAAFLAAGCGAGAIPTPTVPPKQPAAVATPAAANPPAAAAAQAQGARTLPRPEMLIDQNKTYTATIKTNKGTMEAELFAQEVPKTVNNFVYLARQNFYDNVVFHRIIRNFMVQTGDPTGTGTGGPGYRFEDEPVNRPYSRGIIAMANAGPNTNGSQFFIVHGDSPLPPNYTIFGQLTSGLETLDAIANTPVGRSPSGENSAPTERVFIESVTINEK
jgi:cyclophilin family peptidyl-prolyl cis-trans isomerase